MRCKNCGSENDDNRYICENCGSPLYDEEDFSRQNAGSETQTFNAISENEPLTPPAPSANTNEKPPVNKDNKDSEKKSVIVIAILAVVLVAVIASIIVIAQTKSKNNDETTTLPSTSQTDTTAKTTTQNRTTTTKAPETTTEPPTESTTKTQVWSIKVVSKGGGTVKGSGEYKDGDNVTISAKPDNGYEFDGWYANGEKISSTVSYSFTAVDSVSISAVFVPVTTTEPQQSEEIDGGLE